MVELPLPVLIDQCCVFLLHLRIVLLTTLHIINHQACLSPNSEHLDVLNVLGDISCEMCLQSV